MTDHEITLITLVVAIASILVAIIISLLQSKRKKLLYRILVDNKILTTAEVKEGRVEVFFEEEEVSEIALLVLFFRNYGNVPIASEDFASPLIMKFSNACKILSAEIIRTIPETIKPSFNIIDNTISIAPLLINPNDVIVFKILTSKLNHDIKIEARIKGISTIDKRFNSGSNIKARSISQAIIWISGFGSYFVFLLVDRHWRYFFNLELCALSLLFAGVWINLVAVFKIKTYPKELETFLNYKERS